MVQPKPETIYRILLTQQQIEAKIGVEGRLKNLAAQKKRQEVIKAERQRKLKPAKTEEMRLRLRSKRREAALGKLPPHTKPRAPTSILEIKRTLLARALAKKK